MPFASDLMMVDVLADGSYQLAADLLYQGRDNKLVVPAGFCTDFASVPRFLSALVPIAGPYDRASVVHDYLCTELNAAVRTKRRHYKQTRPGVLEQLPYSPVDVDGIFRRILRELGVPTVLRWLFWTGVRWGALTNPARRTGWWSTAPAVLGISLAAAPIVLPVAAVTGIALAAGALAEAVAQKVTA